MVTCRGRNIHIARGDILQILIGRDPFYYLGTEDPMLSRVNSSFSAQLRAFATSQINHQYIFDMTCCKPRFHDAQER